jgi:hypothetical protein
MDKTSKIYKQVKRDADKKFKNHGIYKSSWIVREYRERGGIFKGNKPKNTGLLRWFREEWIRVDPKTGKTMMRNGKRVPCGRSSEEMNKKIKKGLCRPYKRITKKTPKTVGELGVKEMKRRTRLKQKTPNKNIH